MRKLRGIRKHPNELSFQSKTLFVGNKNEIWYYTDFQTGRNYARARFEWCDCINSWMSDEWWQLSKEDIKDDDAFARTEKEINMYFGYFGVEKRF